MNYLLNDLLKYLPLLWSNLWRRPLRTVFTWLSIFIAFLLFGILTAVRTAFDSGIDVAGADRLVTMHKTSFIQLLPVSYRNRMAALDGVDSVASATWFGAYYQEKKNFFANFAVNPEYLDIYPEMELESAELAAFKADRSAALIGRVLADRFGWQAGDKIPLISPIWPNKTSGDSWDFTVAGIFEAGKKGFDTSGMVFHEKYLEEGRAYGEGMVGWYILKVKNPDQSEQISRAVDALFENSPAETKTASEKQFMADFAKQIGDIGAIFTAIVTVVFFSLLLVAGNTMAQAVRERTSDLAVMNVFGFSRRSVAFLVVAESLLLALFAGGTGLLTAYAIVNIGGDPTGGLLPAFFLPTRDIVIGFVLVVVMGLAAGTLPALQAMRLSNIDALRRAA